MSTARKTLKILSFLYVIVGVLDVAFSIFCLVSGPIEVDNYAIGFGSFTVIFLLISGICYVAAGVTGIRGANNPAKAGPALIMTVVCSLIALVNVAMELTQASGASGIVTQACVLAFNVYAIVCANNVKKEGQDRLS